jgi:hypothetical protein
MQHSRRSHQSAMKNTEDTVNTFEYRDKNSSTEPAAATFLLCDIHLLENALSKLVGNMQCGGPCRLEFQLRIV